MQLPQIDNYPELFLNDIPLMDVRAPVEFGQGAFPGAANLPLLNDDERHQIGLRYAEQGQEHAVALGYELVSHDIKTRRVEDWAGFIEQHPGGALYCFRGGMRSKIVQQWIYEATGVAYPRIEGGYKALRRFLLNEFEVTARQIQPLVVGGRTGVGKTLLLNRVRQSVDLEGLYHHRGSAFGNRLTPQPSQIDIENALAIALLKLHHRNIDRLLVEDEARNIGSRSIPEPLYDVLQQAPLLLLEAELDQRVDIVFQEYITDALAEYQSHLGEDEGFARWAEELEMSLDKIQRRLGGARHKVLKAVMQSALRTQRSSGDATQHREWIRTLLENYYDPMYDYQLGKKSERVVFRGNTQALLEYLRHHYAIA
jgi:tRNA 2-selenouridine synthase